MDRLFVIIALVIDVALIFVAVALIVLAGVLALRRR